MRWTALHTGVCDRMLALHIERSLTKNYCVIARCACSAVRLRISRYYKETIEAEAMLRAAEGTNR